MASKSYFVVNIMEYLCDAPMEQISLLQHRVGGVTRNAKATDKTLLQLLKTI